MIKVIKRDGRVKDFDMDRISGAIYKAYREVYGPEIPYEKYLYLVDIIEEDFAMCAKIKDARYTVEEIQDHVIFTMKTHDPVVARAYEEYREKRFTVRDSKNDILESVSKIIDATNKEVLSENSNKQGQLASTQRDLISGEVSKAMARQMIPKHLLEAHDAGLLKIHDLDYYMQGIYNCELVNLEDMLQNGTVINKKMIDTPKSLRTAMTLATQIAAQIASSTYGGQTMTLSHLAPFVRISKEKIRKKHESRGLDAYLVEKFTEQDLKEEIRDAVQTFNYQISTIMCTNGQAPFISVAMYISENPEYEEETALLIEEFLHQRIAGLKNEYGVVATQTFPKLLYFLDENNTYEGSKYFYLTKLAVKSTSIRMNPDYISVKKMKEIIGHAFPPMGCRAFLSPFQNKDGEFIFYGRGNLGAQTINLPYVALSSKGSLRDFWDNLDEALELARQMCELRYEKLRGIKANIAPILWQHGAIARLSHDEDILKAVDERGFTVTVGYSGLYEAVKVLTGESHTEGWGAIVGEQIMRYMRDKLAAFRLDQPHLRFALYGTPQESTTGWFNDKLKAKFGEIEDITDKGWITNSYHVDIREDIDAFKKLELEGKLQSYSTGGAVSYIETVNMNKNQSALIKLVQYMYETIIYSEINFESDVCGSCKFTGVMENDAETLDWVCPQCGNRDQKTLSVVRRTCGYLGETDWTDGRKLDILNRVKHL